MVDDAQFIAELDVNVPTGTDLIADGDNEIRQVKIATKQTFPNADAAVNLTAAQLNGAAIKTEDNVFTGLNTFSQNVNISERVLLNRVGPTTFPQISWRDESSVSVWDLYMDSRAANPNDWRLDRRLAGVLQDTPLSIRGLNGFVDFDTAALSVPGQALRLQTAAGDLPGESAVQTGMLFIGGSKTLRWSFSRQADTVTGDLVINRHDSAGTLQDTPFRMTSANGRATFTGIAFFDAEIRAFTGSQAFPSFTFQGNENTGMFSSGNNVLDLATNGISRFTLTGTELNMKMDQLWLTDGTAARPSYSWAAAPTLGLYRVGTTEFAMSANSLQRARITSRGVNLTIPTSNAGLLSGDLFISSGFVAIVP